MRIRIIYIILMVSILISLASCQQWPINNSQSDNQDYSVQDGLYQNNDDVLDSGPVKGGTIKLFTTTPDTLNPLMTKNSYVNDFLGLIYEGLVRIDSNQKPVPVLSDLWSASADGLVWNFHIRDGVHWSDGQALTADDVAFTVESLLSANADSVYKSLLQNVASFTAIDSSNFKIILQKPNSFTAEMMTFPIVPKHLSQNAFDTAIFKPFGSGPYSFDSYVKGKYVLLKRNEQWWYPATVEDKSAEFLYVDNIKINIYKTAQDAINAFQAGDIDAISVDMDDFNKYDGRTDLFIKKYTSRDFEFIAFNLYNPVIADISVRKAIAAAIDKEKIIKEVYAGDAVLGDIPLNPESWMFEDKIAEALPALSPREILLEGGWKESAGVFRKTINGVGRKLSLELLVNDNNIKRAAVAEKICEQLKNAGITATVKKLSWNDMFALINQTKFDFVYTGCRISQIPDISFLYSSAITGSQLPANQNAAGNIAGYNSAVINQYIDGLYKEVDYDKKKVIYNSIRTTLENDIPYIGFCFRKNGVVYKKNIRGLLEPYAWNRYFDITRWYKPE